MSVPISIRNVVKKYGDNTVIKSLSAEIVPGEFFTLLGPSGCGKTTLLRMIIGFNSIEEGEIYVNGSLINSVPTSRRNMGMVFQNYAVFPHMSVRENVAFGLKIRKLSGRETQKKVDQILDIVRISALKDRMPAQLSGGQQQRVALARAIVVQPEVLLMDEPLSNLDAKLRVEMRNAIKNIQQQIGITTIYVTHDQEEALAVSDRIAVMNEGVIQQIGTPVRIYQRPVNQFVATFIGLSNLLDAEVKVIGGRKLLDFGRYQVEMDNLSDDASDGRMVRVSVRPEEFEIRKDGESGLSALTERSVFLGSRTHCFLKLEDSGKEIEVIQDTDRSCELQNGEKVTLQVKRHKINVFTEDGLKTLITEEN